jgi:hypothetical protein
MDTSNSIGVANKFGAVRWTAFTVTCLALLVLLLAPGARAQLYTASVTGVVTDPSGSAIPSAHVTLTDLEKGFTYAATANENGRFLLRDVPPGSYSIKVEAPNFQSERRDGIKLDVNQNISLDFSLKIGLATETVSVVASSVHLQTEDAVTGQVVNRKFVNDLPLVDRNFFNLATLAPGVVETNIPGGPPTNFNSNGSRNSTADVLIDGASATNFEQNSGIQVPPYTPSVDSVEEFKVQQSNFTAEFGFAGGTVINVVTRSGSNQFHGNVYEFFRNSVMDANEWFANRDGNPIPPLKRNNFGGTLGGPIKKDKTFFFFDYEGLREHSFASSGSLGVPTLCERGQGPCPFGQSALGNFSEVCALKGGTFDNTGRCSVPEGQLWDPYTGTFNSDPAGDGSINPGAVRSTFIPFNDLSSYVSPGNPNLAGTQFQPAPGVAGNLIDPVAANMFMLFPKPTRQAASFDDLQNNNFSTTGTRTNSNNQWDLKIDHRFSENNLLSIKYSQQNGHSTSFNCYKNFADPCTGGPAETTRHVLSINHTHTFSPTTVLTVAFGYVRGFDFSHGVGGEFSNFDSLYASTGFPSYLNNGFKSLPFIEFGNGYNTSIGSQPFAILREGQDSYHLGGALSWLRGKHDLKFGGEGRLHRINFVQPGWPSGDFAFNRNSTAQISSVGDDSTGGDAVASFLTGVGDPQNSGGGCTPCQQGFNNFVSTQSFRYAAFVQDNFKVTPKLTLNLGLRYELSLPRTERFNRMNWLDPNAVSPLSVSGVFDTLHGAEVFASSHDRSNYYTDYKAIQPRFGLAYQLPHSFVLRGGYGIYYSTPRSGASGTGPWGFQGFNIQPPWLTTLNIDHATPFNTLKNTSCLFSDPSNCGVAPPPGSSLGAFNDIGFDAVGPVRKISQDIPYEQAWSFGFQKELPGKVLFDASYVGKKGTHLYLGGFRNMDFLPQSAIAGLTPSQIGALNDQVANPFFFPGPSSACDKNHFICDPTSPLAGPTVSQAQLLLPFPQYTSFAGDSPPIANSIYHALQVRAEREFSNGLQFLVTYTWSKSIDNASATDDSISWLGGGTTDGSTISVQNPFDLRGERAVSVYDIPHVLQFSYVYELPVGKGRQFGSQMHPALNAIIGGWQVNGIIRIDNGRPIIPGLDSSTPIPTYSQRPNLSGNLGRSSGSPEASTDPNTGTNYFANPNALSQPADNTFGTAPRTIGNVRQPGARDVSMSLFKEFPLGIIREGMRIQFRAESFNTFNHPHFAGPNANFGASDYGFISNTIGSPRELQLALKLYF